MSNFDSKYKAIALRTEGYSLKEIAEKLHVPKSTIATWSRDVVLNNAAIARLSKTASDGRTKGRLMGAGANKQLREQRVHEAEEWAKQKVKTLDTRDILLMGIGLYWGEGAKARQLNFTNSDPKLLLFIQLWFERVLGVSRQDFLVRIYINESHKDRYEKVKKFWMKTLNLPAGQFYQPTFLKTKLSKVYENRETYYGVVSLRIKKSTELQYRILGLIKAVSHAGVAQVVRAHHS